MNRTLPGDQLESLTCRAVRRVLDVAGAVVGLGITAALFLPIAICIKLDSPGRILFRQTRITRGNRPFRFYKFRTMVVDDELTEAELATMQEPRHVASKRPDDPRITRVGCWLRRYSLDELPQFWCVLNGDMSLVGPRPPLASEVSNYGVYELARLRVNQGMTGLWQVSGRSTLSFEEMIRLDRHYVECRSLLLDLRVLLQTIPAVVRGDGAF